MPGARIKSTPLAAHFHLSADLAPQSEAKSKYMSQVTYASTVRSLIYAMMCIRPNIAHAVRVASRYMVQPEKRHWEAVKQIFGYLNGTTVVGFIYEGDDAILDVSSNSNLDYSGDLNGRKSLTGCVFTLSCSIFC